MLPSSNGALSEALAIVYRGTYGTPVQVTFSPRSLGISDVGVTSYEVVDVFDDQHLGIIKPGQTLTLNVNPTGVRFLRLNVNPHGMENSLLTPSPSRPGSLPEAASPPAAVVKVTEVGKIGWQYPVEHMEF